jgi:hypothetical protein
VARSASLEHGRSLVYFNNTVAPRRRIRLATVADGLRFCEDPVGLATPPPT